MVNRGLILELAGIALVAYGAWMLNPIYVVIVIGLYLIYVARSV